jgi:hypothetical protein
MEEIIIKKVSVTKTSIDIKLLDIVNQYVKNNENKFKDRQWNCNSKTSHNLCYNVLHDVVEFKYIREAITEKIKIHLEENQKASIPFLIDESWINIIYKFGYQEFHKHTPAFASGTLYVSDYTSDIEFACFPENNRKLITPQKGDLLFFSGETYHRVVDSKNKRISLSFNIYAP